MSAPSPPSPQRPSLFDSNPSAETSRLRRQIQLIYEATCSPLFDAASIPRALRDALGCLATYMASAVTGRQYRCQVPLIRNFSRVLHGIMGKQQYAFLQRNLLPYLPAEPMKHVQRFGTRFYESEFTDATAVKDFFGGSLVALASDGTHVDANQLHVAKDSSGHHILSNMIEIDSSGQRVRCNSPESVQRVKKGLTDKDGKTHERGTLAWTFSLTAVDATVQRRDIVVFTMPVNGSSKIADLLPIRDAIIKRYREAGVNVLDSLAGDGETVPMCIESLKEHMIRENCPTQMKQFMKDFDVEHAPPEVLGCLHRLPVFTYDPLHMLLRLWRQCCASQSARLVIGNHFCHITQMLLEVRQHRLKEGKAPLRLSNDEILTSNRMSESIVRKIFNKHTVACLYEYAATRAEHAKRACFATIICVDAITRLVDAFWSFESMDKCLVDVFTCVALFRMQRNVAIQRKKHFKDISYPSLSTATARGMELFALTLVSLNIKYQGKHCPIALNRLSSQVMESLFRKCRSLSSTGSTQVTFSFVDFIRRLHVIDEHSRLTRTTGVLDGKAPKGTSAGTLTLRKHDANQSKVPMGLGLSSKRIAECIRGGFTAAINLASMVPSFMQWLKSDECRIEDQPVLPQMWSLGFFSSMINFRNGSHNYDVFDPAPVVVLCVEDGDFNVTSLVFGT